MQPTGGALDQAALADLKHITGSQRVLCVAIAGDIAIATSKFAAALTGSSAMLAEGVHSLLDTGNELLLLHRVKSSRRAVNEWHPFGYGKATCVWALMVSLSVFSIGGGVSIYEGIVSLSGAPALGDPTWNYIVLAIAAVFEGFSWCVSRRELNRHRRPNESLWQVSQRSMDVLVFTVFVEDSAALTGQSIGPDQLAQVRKSSALPAPAQPRRGGAGDQAPGACDQGAVLGYPAPLSRVGRAQGSFALDPARASTALATSPFPTVTGDVHESLPHCSHCR
jgi:Cation efflux family